MTDERICSYDKVGICEASSELLNISAPFLSRRQKRLLFAWLSDRNAPKPFPAQQGSKVIPVGGIPTSECC
jgi:hypothetical protein